MVKICPVCGFDDLDSAPYDNNGNPSYEICSCCGFEFGFHDSSEHMTFEKYREEWMLRGFPFEFKPDIPNIWNEEIMRKQLLNISRQNYSPRLLR